jgi:YihY family inner membrane protein
VASAEQGSNQFDGLQRRHRALGLPIAVVYKFTDDQGPYLASLLTYYGFCSVFPLLLLAVTILGFVLGDDISLQKEIISSALGEFPVIGQQLADVHSYHGSDAGIVIGLAGAFYGGLGVAQAGQNAMNVVWAIPRDERSNPLTSRIRSLLFLLTAGVAVLLTTALSGIATGAGAFNSHLSGLGVWVRVADIALGAVLDAGIFVVGFRILTVASVRTRDLVVGAVLAGLVWQALQDVGTFYIAHELRRASAVYGLFAIVLGLIAWLHVEALVVVFCAELNVVVCRRLYPRALLTPFTDDVDLTSADRRAYTSYAKAQRNKGFEHIGVRFGRHRSKGRGKEAG